MITQNKSGMNLAIRTGFFAATTLGCVFAGMLLTLMLEPTQITRHPAWLIFLGLCCYAGLEIFFKSSRDSHSGIDDALLWVSALLLTTGTYMWASDTSYPSILISTFILLISLWLTLRFANAIMSSISCLAFLSLVFFAGNEAGQIGEATMPFLIMLCSYLIYNFLARAEMDTRTLNYRRCLLFMQVTSLLCLYAAGNYFVVQTLSDQLHHLTAKRSIPIPFGWLFWIWTLLLPFGYLGLGIKKKSLMFLRLGLLLIAAAAYTYRSYYHLMEIEYMLVVAGGVLLLVSLLLIKYLKTPRAGFIYTQGNPQDLGNEVNIEDLVVVGLASHAPTLPAESESRFGGGSFGGGGASGDF